MTTANVWEQLLLPAIFSLSLRENEGSTGEVAEAMERQTLNHNL